VQKTRSWGGTTLAALALATTTAYAGHPMLSEDTGTQGLGNAELELGYAWSRQDGTSVFLFQPQLSVGTSSTFDLIVQPSWTLVHLPGGQHEKGLGDTNLDFKWRFYGAAPLEPGLTPGYAAGSRTGGRDLYRASGVGCGCGIPRAAQRRGPATAVVAGNYLPRGVVGAAQRPPAPRVTQPLTAETAAPSKAHSSAAVSH